MTLTDQLLSHAAAGISTAPAVPGADPVPEQKDLKSDQAFWYELINEEAAADFVGLKPRTMQGYRYRGRGPPFVCLSARLVKYRRIDLLRWAEAHLRTSTSDSGPATA